MDTYLWYQTLIKPSWAPPSYLFGPVWTVLYIVIAISFGSAFYLAAKKRLPINIIWPFLLNLCFNAIFTPLQFGLQNNLLAALDIVLVLATLIWAIVSIYPHQRWIALINIPYLLWVIFATVLQLTITSLNLQPQTAPITNPIPKSIMSETDARQIAEDTCIKGGGAIGKGTYNPNSKTWWFDANLNATQPGCFPACVVNEQTKTASINWRCTGALPPQ